MSNPWFQFKQFRIAQDKCAMKVTTDACIQGAWTPIPAGAKNILDIGTGTGLLALMAAQRAGDATITAYELDTDAAEQARQNAEASPWANRITVHQGDIRQIDAHCQYQLIVCNPPFFSNSLLGPVANRNQARHNLELTAHELLQKCSQLLHDSGIVSLLYPYADHAAWTHIAESYGLNLEKTLEVLPRAHKPPNRVVALFTKQLVATPATTQLTIRIQDGSYSTGFNKLLKAYYLYL